MDLPLNLVQFLGYNLMGLAHTSPIIDPQKLWQTLKKFDYPFYKRKYLLLIFYLLFLLHVPHKVTCRIILLHHIAQILIT